MGLIAELIKAVETDIINRLKDYGFEKQTQNGPIVKLLEGDVYGWVGLNGGARGTLPNGNHFLALVSVIGIHHRAIALFLKEFAGWESARLWTATVSRTIHALVEKKPNPEYEFYAEESIAYTIDRLIKDVISFGVPYMHKLCDYNFLEDQILRYQPIEYRAYKIPAMWTLLGDRERALQLNDFVEKPGRAGPQSGPSKIGYLANTHLTRTPPNSLLNHR